ncbi:MAG TPA: hypothetical protein DIW47_06785 [Bacteroidetes bacterium]|nr:hypothetical protein [Bacteroidota bacterium]
MTRKEFLINFWNKVFKPFLFLLAGAFSMYFLYLAIFEPGNERNFVVLMTALGLIYVLLYVVGRLFQNTVGRLNRKIPVLWRTGIRDVLRIISPLVFLFHIYVSWKNDKMGTLILFAILLTEFIFRESKRPADRS